MFLKADRCSNCGATEAEALLGAFMRHVGGVGHVAAVECRDQRACWRRRDARDGAETIAILRQGAATRNAALAVNQSAA